MSGLFKLSAASAENGVPIRVLQLTWLAVSIGLAAIRWFAEIQPFTVVNSVHALLTNTPIVNNVTYTLITITVYIWALRSFRTKTAEKM